VHRESDRVGTAVHAERERVIELVLLCMQREKVIELVLLCTQRK